MVRSSQTITQIEGPAASPLYPYRPARIRGGRVTQQQILDLWEGNVGPWEENYWSRLDDTLHHLMGGPLRVDQRIATPAGWKPIGEAQVDDAVFGPDGQPTRILGVYPQGVLPMYRVTFTDGAEVVCDDTHSWTVSTRYTTRTLTLREILDQGLFTTNGDGKLLHAHRIPITEPLELPSADLPLDPYLLGYLIGDGSFVGTSPSITCAEPEEEQPWRRVLPDTISVTRQGTPRPGVAPVYGLVYRKRHTNPITAALTELGLWGKRDRFKSIPEVYLWASQEQRWSLLQGLLDADGSPADVGSVEFSTVSADLAQDVTQLVQSLGGVAKTYLRPSRRRAHHGYIDSACYRVHISIPPSVVREAVLHLVVPPFRLARKIARWQPRITPYVRAIHAVERIEDAEAVCIKVDRPDGLFLTEGMVVTHNTRFILPDEFLENVEGREHMVVIFPQKITTPLKIINLLGNRRPKAMRYAVGLTMSQEGIATDVETWLNAVLTHDVDGRPLLNYRELVGRTLIEGAVVVKCLSSDAHWRRSLSWLDLLDREEYEDLKPRQRKRYRPEEDVEFSDEELDEIDQSWTRGGKRATAGERYVRVDTDGVPVPRRQYHRDARGRTRDDPYYRKPRKDRHGKPVKWTEDRGASRKAFEEDQKEWLARRLPFEVEIISARHCIPLMDDNERVEAILVMREYDPIEAIGKNLIWGNDQDMLIPADPEQGGPIVVYELWHTDERDRPYVAYFVDGYAWTAFRGDDEHHSDTTTSGYMPGEGEASDDDATATGQLADAIIDLRREYGCSTLPIRWFWGLHLPIDDITRKAIPFLWPVLSSINAAEGLATAIHIYAWRNAFAGAFIQLDPQILERYGSLFAKNGDLFRFSLGPMENVVVPGRPQIASAPDPGAGVQQLLQMLLQASAAMSPSDAAFGGSGSTSGHDRALSREYLEVALSQVLESSRLAVKFVAERILEYAVWIAEKTGHCVPVYANTPISQVSARTGSTRPAMDVIELKPSWLKSNTEVHTYFENDEADELKRQQLAQQHMQGLVPWDQYRTEAWNDPAPEVTLIKIFGDQALRTPEGRAEVLEFASELRSDEQDQQKEKLIKEGLLSQDGLPTKARIPFTPKRLLASEVEEEDALGLNGTNGQGGMPDLAALLAGAGSLNPEQNAVVAGGLGRQGLGAEAAGLPPGVQPPAGVTPELMARHLQLDRSHQAARGLAAGAGPLGAIGGSANAGGLAPAGPGGPVGLPGALPQGIIGTPGADLMSRLREMPPGVEGAADIPSAPPQGAAAPGLPGMTGGGVGKSNELDSQLGGVIAGQLRRAAKRYHSKKRGPRAPGNQAV